MSESAVVPAGGVLCRRVVPRGYFRLDLASFLLMRHVAHLTTRIDVLKRWLPYYEVGLQASVAR